MSCHRLVQAVAVERRRARRPRAARRGSSGAGRRSRSVGTPRYTGPLGAASGRVRAGHHGVSDLGGRRDERRRLGHRREHRGLVAGLVQAAAIGVGAADGRRNVGGDDQHGRARRHRLAGGAQGVGRARAGGDDRHAEAARRARVPVGGVDRCLLVADADEPDRGLRQRLPDREVVDSGQPEGNRSRRGARAPRRRGPRRGGGGLDVGVGARQCCTRGAAWHR